MDARTKFVATIANILAFNPDLVYIQYMNAARHAATAQSCTVLLTRVAGYTTPSVDVFGSDLAGAVARAAELTADHADDMAWEAKKVSRGWKGERTPARTFEVVTVTGNKAAEIAHIEGEIEFNSQDEAQSDTRSTWSAALVALFV